MSHPGFFDLQHRYEGLDAKGDPLVAIAAAVPFDLFRGELHAALVAGGLRTADGMRKSAAGRKPWDEVLIFKVLVLQALYNLSDDQMEYQLRDRLSFMRFVGLGLEDTVPDAKTLWLYRETLAKAGAVGCDLRAQHSSTRLGQSYRYDPVRQLRLQANQGAQMMVGLCVDQSFESEHRDFALPKSESSLKSCAAHRGSSMTSKSFMANGVAARINNWRGPVMRQRGADRLTN